MITTAVIMAAGLGTRFGTMTRTMPKGFIEVGGVSMIERSVKVLISCGIRRLIIGTGYHKEAYENLAKIYSEIECVFSPRYAETNSMYTLFNCQDVIGNDDFLLLESDIIFSQNAITELQNSNWQDVMLITPVTKFQDQYYVEYGNDGILTNCSTDKNAVKYKGELVGIHRLSNAFYKQMCSEFNKILEDKLKLGYEYQLLYMSQHIKPMYVLNAYDVSWYEIDDTDDLEFAEKNILNNIQ